MTQAPLPKHELSLLLTKLVCLVPQHRVDQDATAIPMTIIRLKKFNASNTKYRHRLKETREQVRPLNKIVIKKIKAQDCTNGMEKYYHS